MKILQKFKISKTVEEKFKESNRKKILKIINNKLKEIIKEDLPFFKIVKKFVIESGGKRIRPLTHFYFCKLLNYSGEEWVDIAAIGELIHAASLLHDDVIDESFERRGIPTINKIHGNKKAILGGDYLLACGIDHLVKLKIGYKILPLFTRTIKNLAVAEILQMEYEENINLTKEIYDKIILGKTADLFSVMVESAAILSNVPEKKLPYYKQNGLLMGRLFQIRDDYLDYFSTKEELGKELYLDYKRGLITYPILVLKDYLTKKEEKEVFVDWKNFEKRQKKLNLVLDLMNKYKVKKKIAIEIEQTIHNIMLFIRNHSTENIIEKEEMLATLSKLLVPVEN